MSRSICENLCILNNCCKYIIEGKQFLSKAQIGIIREYVEYKIILKKGTDSHCDHSIYASSGFCFNRIIELCAGKCGRLEGVYAPVQKVWSRSMICHADLPAQADPGGRI